MNVVMADQSERLGMATAAISAIERGAAKIPESYIKTLIEWFQLDDSEATELTLLSKLRHGRSNVDPAAPDIIKLLDQVPTGSVAANEKSDVG